MNIMNIMNMNTNITYNTIYSPTTYLYRTRSIKEAMWKRAEDEYADMPKGTRILAKVDVNNNVFTKYVSIRTNDGYVRNTIVFREGELDPFPVNVVYTENENENSE